MLQLTWWKEMKYFLTTVTSLALWFIWTTNIVLYYKLHTKNAHHIYYASMYAFTSSSKCSVLVKADPLHAMKSDILNDCLPRYQHDMLMSCWELNLPLCSQLSTNSTYTINRQHKLMLIFVRKSVVETYENVTNSEKSYKF